MSSETEHYKSLLGKQDGAPVVADAKWHLAVGLYSGDPYLRTSCSTCHTTWETTSNDPAIGAFKHCRKVEEPPKELVEKLVQYQIAKGIRRAPSIFQRITGQTPDLAKAF